MNIINHIEIYVSNILKSKEFYSFLLPILGMTKYQEWEEGFSYRDDSDTYIVFVQTSEKYLEMGYNRCRIGLNHLAFNCENLEQLNFIKENLVKKSVQFLYEDRYPFAGGDKNYRLYFEDPDRIKLEIIVASDDI